jgi:hypothetical protein
MIQTSTSFHVKVMHYSSSRQTNMVNLMNGLNMRDVRQLMRSGLHVFGDMKVVSRHRLDLVMSVLESIVLVKKKNQTSLSHIK